MGAPTDDVLDDPDALVEEERASARRIISVGGGKGGVGKSLLAANLAIYLAQLGKRVVLVDADLGGANLHTFLGIDRPHVTLGDFFAHRLQRIEQCVVETSVPHLGLVSAEGDPVWAASPKPEARNRLLAGVRDLDVDYLICDLPPGSGLTAVDFFLLSDAGVLVVVPEPTSIENTFRFIKSAFMRRLRRTAGIERIPPIRDCEGGIPAPLDLYQAARTLAPDLAARIAEEMHRFRPLLVVNQTRARADLDLGAQLRSAGRRRLGLAVDYLGHLESDDAVWQAVRRRRPLVVEYPEAKVSKNIEKVARRLLALEAEKPTPRDPPRPTEEQSLYEVLELDPGASDEEVRRAYRRAREVYTPESMVTSGLFSNERLEVVQRRAEEAYDMLLDPERRKRYDLERFPDGVPGVPAIVIAPTRPPRADETPVKELPPEPDVDPSTEFTGDLLRRIRESRAVELLDIAQRTKIGLGHLRAIEEERWEALPAQVYLRGFLIEYARCLKLDPAQVTRTYLERWHRERGASRPTHDDGA